MIITPMPYLPYAKVDKQLGTVQTTVIEDKINNFSRYTLIEEDLPSIVKKEADSNLKAKARKLNADAVICVHYVPYTTKFDTGSLSDDTYSMYAYGVPIKFRN